MATATRVSLSPKIAGIFHAPDIKEESAKKGSELLQKNHDDFHAYFNNDGFHNHIAHHLLSLFALGATPQEIQKAYDSNASYQRPQFGITERNVEDMSDKNKFKEFLGKEKYFHDFEVFFSKEIEAKGWQAVLNEHVFAKDEKAETMFTRLYAGFLHPIIHLGFGVEFQQPAIIAEALAQAATHDDWTATFLLQAEAKAKQNTTNKTLVELIHECQANEKLRNSPHWDDPNKVRDGIFKRAANEMIDIASQWHVKPEDLEKKTAEMINTAAFFTAGSQHPPKHVKIDFFYMHCTNCSIFFSTFAKQPWLSVENKCRLLEMKGRLDLALYVSRGSPDIMTDEITNYSPKQPQDGWPEIFKRVDNIGDDGHACKLVRAFAHGQQACKPFEEAGGNAFPIKGDMWLKMGHIAIDSVELASGPRWIRNAGFDQAWNEVPNRSRL